ncbi:MAG TPA: hypothetical protein VE219_06085, partial [Candidatus Sulfotelmatobacter sp.]|nr:hypothetical protein [Candidatus Sulfotelmatobacter sp.]
TTVNILNTPNQTISVGPVTLTINQQLYDAGTNTATGNALVIDMNVANVLTGKITVAHAESDLTHCTAALVSLPKTGSDQPEGVQFLNSQQPASSGVDGRFALIPVASLVFFAAVVVLSRTLGRRYARRMAEKG